MPRQKRRKRSPIREAQVLCQFSAEENAQHPTVGKKVCDKNVSKCVRAAPRKEDVKKISKQSKQVKCACALLCALNFKREIRVPFIGAVSGSARSVRNGGAETLHWPHMHWLEFQWPNLSFSHSTEKWSSVQGVQWISTSAAVVEGFGDNVTRRVIELKETPQTRHCRQRLAFTLLI